MHFTIERSSDEGRIEAFLSENDAQFVPPLSSRVDINQYSIKLARSAVNWFATARGHDVAHAAMYANDATGRQAFVSSLAVAAQHAGKGLGHALLTACVEHARSVRLASVELDVDSSNRSARNFYSQHGFHPMPQRHESTVRMRLDLQRGASAPET